MSAIEFVHLHNHTEYSLLDGACRVGDLCRKAKDLGMSAVAMTDHGAMFANIRFCKAAREADIKAIYGCELYMAPASRTVKEGGDRGSNNHLLVLAADMEGYHNLIRLCSEAYRTGFYYKPRIDMELLARHHKGLIVASACLKGTVAEAVVHDDVPRADRFIDAMKQLLGPERFFLEVMDHGLEDQKKANPGIISLAQRHGLGLIATNDTHYLTREDHEMHDILLCIGTGRKRSDEKRMRYSANEFYLKSPEQMHALFGDVPGALSNTVRIAEMCNVTPPMTKSSELYPSFQPPEGYTSQTFLHKLCEDGLLRRYGATPSEVHRRQAEYELKVIHDTGFDDYFLIVWDFINHAKHNGISVGPGRGSGAGSIVAYCLEITDIDPIEHKLIFERFLNIERLEPPDFDIDFCAVRRGEVVDYVRRKYGAQNVCNIATFGALKAKNAIRDVGRVLDVPLDRVNQVCALVPNDPKARLKDLLAENNEFRRLAESDPQVREMLSFARRVEGLHRNPGVHAAGVIITDKPVSEYAPVFCPNSSNTEELCCQYDMSDVTATGLLKMDFLGLKNLTVIENASVMIRHNHGVEVDWTRISRSDTKTYEFLRTGQTQGVFQLESSGMRDLIRRLGPTCFADVAAIIALYRPGPMAYIPTFIERKKNPARIAYVHPMLEEILSETYGIIVYQEQVMEIAQKMGGFSMGQGDILRKAMGKKNEELMAKMKVLFLEGAAGKGVGPREAQAVWDLMAEFAKYGFNKAHTVAYAEVSFRTAWLKAHYPVEFLAALMTNDMNDTDKMAVLFAEAREMGIRLLPPDVNESYADFTVVHGNIRFGLAAIKNVGGGAVRALIVEREANGAFKSFQDLCERTLDKGVNARMLECMIKVGAFDSLGYTRAALTLGLPQLIAGAQMVVSDRAAGQMSLFGDSEADGGQMAQEDLPKVREWGMKEKLEYEKELTGFFITGHPLDALTIDIQSFSTTNTRELANLENQAPVRLVGQVADVRRITTRNGDPMAFVQIEDFQGAIEGVIFPRLYPQVEHSLVGGAMVVVQGHVNDRDGRKSMIIDQLWEAEPARMRLAKFLDLILPVGSISPENIGALKQALGRHTGGCKVRVVLETGEGPVRVLADKRFSIQPRDELLRELEKLPFTKKIRLSEN